MKTIPPFLCLLAVSLYGCTAGEFEHVADSPGGVPPKTAANAPVHSEDAEVVMVRRVEDYFAAYATGGRDAYAAWLRENRTDDAYTAAPLEARLEMYAFSFERSGALTIVESTQLTPFMIEVVARPERGRLRERIVFHFDPSPPYLIGPMETGAVVDLPATWNSMREFATELQRASGIPAVALGVMIAGQIVDQAVVGTRTVGRDDPAQLADTFHWGSITKAVTGTVIGKLIEDGELAWHTRIGDALSGTPMRDAYRDATISQLMCHEAGIPPYGDFSEDLVATILATANDSSDTEARRAFVRHALLDEPVAPAGAEHVYSNAGISIAGYIAEAATGESWESLVRKHVFDPAEMTTAGFGWPVTAERTDQPQGHIGDGPHNYDPMPVGAMRTLLTMTAPAGNVRSSVADLLRFGNLHLQGMNGEDGYLKSDTVTALHTPRPGAVPWQDSNYTFGWGHNECRNFFDAPACHGHNGGAGTFYAEIKIIPGRDMVIAYMGNAAEPTEVIAQQVFAAVYERYAGPRPNVPRDTLE